MAEQIMWAVIAEDSYPAALGQTERQAWDRAGRIFGESQADLVEYGYRCIRAAVRITEVPNA